jgi:hypothetical protein
MKRITMIVAVAANCIISARGQSFSNLNFDLAQNLPGNPTNGVLVSATNALPDWFPYAGSSALSSIYYVSNIDGYFSIVELEGGSLALSGNEYSVELNAGASIGQTGAVPVNAESLQFEANDIVNLEVALGGQNLSYALLSEGSGYNVYGANIPTDMEGQTEALTFSVLRGGANLIDAIEFSPTTIPEPSQYALIGLGAIAIGLWRRGVRFKVKGWRARQHRSARDA